MLKEHFSYLGEVKLQDGDSWFNVPADKLLETCTALRKEYECLNCLTGTDRGEYLEVVYHLFSYETKKTLIIKVRLDVIARSTATKQSPEPNLGQGIASSAMPPRNDTHFSSIPSVSSIWPSANWMEREVFDLLGIKFDGHPDLRRIMLPEDWVGHPLLKSYKEPAEYCGMTTAR